MRKILFLVCLPLVLADAPALAAKPADAVIDGTWENACLPIGKNGRHGFIVRVTIARKTMTAVSQTYAHSNCDTPTVKIDYRAKIVARAVSGDAVDFDHVVTSITMTAQHPEVVTIYNADNANAGCGMGGGWVLDVPRQVEGRNCAPLMLPVAGTRLYERAWVVDGQLKIGSFPVVWANTSPDKRPTAPGLLVLHRVT